MSDFKMVKARLMAWCAFLVVWLLYAVYQARESVRLDVNRFLIFARDHASDIFWFVMVLMVSVFVYGITMAWFERRS